MLRPFNLEATTNRIRIDNLDLNIAGGRIQLAGLVDLDEESDIRAAVQNVSMGRLAKLFPGLDAQGTISGRVYLKGPADGFTAALSTSTEGMVIDDLRIGTITLKADYQPGKLTGWMKGTGGIGRHLAAGFTLGADIDLAAQKATLRSDAVYLYGQVSALDLAVLNRFMPDIPLLGFGTAKVVVTGDLNAPTVHAEASVNDLGVRGVSMGKLSLTASYRSGEAQTSLHLSGPAADRIYLSATVPMGWEAQRPVWRFSSPHHIELKIEKGRFESLAT